MIIFRKKIAGLSESTLARFMARARRMVRLRGRVNVLITGDREMKGFNRHFRGKNYATDVLSFPAQGNTGFAGDVAISAEIASQNAKRLGHSCAQEIKILALHGLLHLAGYDHEADRGEMARAEEKFRRRLKLAGSLIERSSARDHLSAKPNPTPSRAAKYKRRAQ